MAPLGQQAAIFQQQNLIGCANLTEAMGNQEACAPLERCV